MSLRGRDVVVGAWIAGVVLACTVFFLPQWHEWNADSRLDMTAAIVNHDTLAINAYHDNTEDDDYFHGKYYSSKDPGQGLVGIPVLLALKGMIATVPGRAVVDRVESNSAWNSAVGDAAHHAAIGSGSVFIGNVAGRERQVDFALLQYLETALTVALPAALFAALFFWFLARFALTVADRVVLTLGLSLGTVFFPYSQQVISHVPAAVLLFAGFAIVHTLGEGQEVSGRLAAWILKHRAISLILAGLALGLSMLFEYYGAIGVLATLVYGWRRLSGRDLAIVVSAILPSLLVILTLDHIEYGKFLQTGYGCYEPTFRAQNCQGEAGFTLPPKLNALYGLTLSPSRGMFFLSPWLLLAIPGFAVWLRRRPEARDTALCVLFIILATTVAISMFGGWNGGAAVGPRYLIATVPFLVLAIAVLISQYGRPIRIATWLLVVLSCFVTWAETVATHDYPSSTFTNPLFQYSLPAIRAGNLRLNLGNFLGASGASVFVILIFGLAVWTAACGLLVLAKRPVSDADATVIVSRGVELQGGG